MVALTYFMSIKIMAKLFSSLIGHTTCLQKDLSLHADRRISALQLDKNGDKVLQQIAQQHKPPLIRIVRRRIILGRRERNITPHGTRPTRPFAT